MVRITWQDLMKNPPIQAGGEEYKEKTAGLGIEKTGCSGKSDRYPHFPKFSRFGVDNYFFKFSILHNHQLDFPHPVKSNRESYGEPDYFRKRADFPAGAWYNKNWKRN